MLRGAALFGARQLRIEKADVERGVVDDQLGVRDEGQELVGDLGEPRLLRQIRRARCRALLERRSVDVALGIEVAMEMSGRVGRRFSSSTQPISMMR